MDRGHHPRVNEEIDAPAVLLVGADGESIGIVPIAAALERARAQGCDLVEVQPGARPPVCRIVPAGEVERRARKRAERRAEPEEIRSLVFRPGMREADHRLRILHGKAFLVAGGAIDVRIARTKDRGAAGDLLGRVLGELSPEGTASGPTKTSREEIVARVVPSAGRAAQRTEAEKE